MAPPGVLFCLRYWLYDQRLVGELQCRSSLNVFFTGPISNAHLSSYDLGEIDAVVEGEESKVGFNGKYLNDVLSVLPETQVALETTNASSPGVIRPVGTENYIHVVMPMFVQW